MIRSLFPRKDSGKIASRRLLAFDVLRGLAATVVFLFHYTNFAAPQTQDGNWVDSPEWLFSRLGGLGTNMLLFLSGYFMAQGIASKRFSYAGFLRWRLVRIYVPYLAMVGLAIGFARLFPNLTRADMTAATIGMFLEQMLLFPGLFPAQPVLTVTWTLSYIVAGYLLFPLVEMGSRGLRLEGRGRLLAWALVTAAVFGLGLLPNAPSVRFSYIPAGCLLYEWHVSEGANERRSSGFRRAVAAGVLLLVLRLFLEESLPNLDWPPALRKAAYSCVGILFVSSIVELTAIAQREYLTLQLFPVFPYLAGFGRTSYSFYLVHGPAVKLFALLVFPAMSASHLPAVTYWLVMPVCWVFAAAGALLLYRMVESPLRQTIHRSVHSAEDPRLLPVVGCGQADRLYYNQEAARSKETTAAS